MNRVDIKSNQYTAARELATVTTVRVPGSWLPVTQRGVALDTRQWSTRAARGLSWQAHGMAKTSRLAH